MLDATRRLEAGRRAHASADWAAALDHLSAARSENGLDGDDLVLLAQSAWWLGRLDDSLALSEEAFRHFDRAEQVPDAVMTAFRLCLLWVTRGDMTIGAAWFNRGRRLLDERADLDDSPARGYQLFLQAGMGLEEFPDSWAPRYATALDDLARRVRDPAITALSMAVSEMTALRAGETRHGFALLDEAMLSVVAGDLPAEWAGEIYCTTIRWCHELADFRRMADWTGAMERWSERYSSDAIYNGACRVHRLELMSFRGEWTPAEQGLQQESADLASGNPWVAGEGFYQLGEIRRMRGDIDGAREAYDLASASGIQPLPGEALVMLREGQPDSAWAAISAQLGDVDALARVRLLGPGVEIALAAGRTSQAHALADELRTAADRYATRGFRVWAAHATGIVALADGDLQTARGALRDAVDAYREDRRPYDTARALVCLARAHDLAGDGDAATHARAQATDILTRLGAAAEIDQVTCTPVPGGLTEREAEVLESVARGASNREVAAQLCISEKTVARHLANVYLKVGVGSRTAAAAWWRDHAGSS